MCHLILTNPELLSGLWGYFKNNTLLGTNNYPKTHTSAYDIFFSTISRHHCAKHMHHLGRWHLYSTIKHSEIQYEGMVSYHSKKSHATFDIRQRTIQETASALCQTMQLSKCVDVVRVVLIVNIMIHRQFLVQIFHYLVTRPFILSRHVQGT